MTLLVALYVVGVLLPLHWVATQVSVGCTGAWRCKGLTRDLDFVWQEAQKAAKRLQVPESTSFRRELRRRGSYSVGYVTDIKSHVFACC